MSKKVALVEVLVRIVAPADDVPNEVMDAALRTWLATAMYTPPGKNGRTILQRMIEHRFINGVDVLGAAGFEVEVVPLDGEEDL